MDNKRNALIITFGIILVLVCSLLALGLGAVPLSFGDIFSALLGKGGDTAQRILLYVRLPRLLASLLAGAALSVSGLIIQTVLANPLASPGIIGVNAGAGLFAAVAMVLLPGIFWAIPAAAFLGALLTALTVYGIAKKAGASRMTLILSGVAISSIMTAGINLLSNLQPDILRSLRDFQTGGFAGVSASTLFPAGVVIVVCATLSWLFGGELEILGLGEEMAVSLGLNVRFYRFFF